MTAVTAPSSPAGTATAYLAKVKTWAKDHRQVPGDDALALIAAVEDMLTLAAKWDKQAKRLDNRAGKTDGDAAAGLYYRAQAHQDNAEAVRAAIEAALTGTQVGT